ncbi:MAG: acetyl-CoA carboxylase carboxyltransferase subunit alpha [Chitinophagales bacterium]|jgi:acetyl-CoA carboxylase carboxyl transferase subunit alpha|nr:acetyl-CoA carboxylase carboxyltransferase subunit alpha [Sphingobacteriales bacterium]MBP6663877.1 acetyl-CoA carboxylase carboxyltransferase subunit alpha [Chitinophagales bacterium]MBP7533001.1 acetyl-CoA carboxylase carboxyltransferase subunit alpha [Chitinophagales bacterium]
MVYLDFEKPLEELQERLTRIKEIGTTEGVDVSKTVEDLESKLIATRQKLYSNLSRWQKVQLSRHPERPYTLQYAKMLFENFTELHGDRQVGDDKAMVGGFASFNGRSVVIIGHQKGTDTKSRQYRNFGMANPEGYRKALRLMKMAEKFNKPVICFIDTPGAFPGLEAEERGQAEAIARNLFEMSKLRVPILCIIIGEGASGGALGIGIGDRILMLENTWYSVISPESCSSILWRSWEFKERAAEQLQLTAEDMLRFGLIDEIVKEPLGGAHQNPLQMAATLKQVIEKHLSEISSLEPTERIKKRIHKFASMGEFQYKS